MRDAHDDTPKADIRGKQRHSHAPKRSLPLGFEPPGTNRPISEKNGRPTFPATTASGLRVPQVAAKEEGSVLYKRGGLGDVKVKKFLNNVLQEELSPIRARRAEYEKNIEGVYEILKKGSEVAAETAAQTLSEVKAAMKINYFDDPAFLEEQIQKFNE